MSKTPEHRPGLWVWKVLADKPDAQRLPFLAHAEQRAKRESDLLMLRAIRDCRAMLEAGELPPADKAPDGSEPPSA
jgi:hypothetical protein